LKACRNPIRTSTPPMPPSKEKRHSICLINLPYRYGLLDAQVCFLKGWFRDTLPTIPAAQSFAVIRLDGDLYESTWDALTGLYPKLSPGGYCLIDDYGGIPACRNDR